MTEIQRGFRDALSRYADITKPLTVKMSVSGPGKYECICMVVDESGLSSRHAMTFTLADMPSVSRILFIVSTDAGTMGEISSHTLTVNDTLTLSLTGQDFRDEKAVISAEFYRKNNDWRIAATASGFNGGLHELLEQSGIHESKVSLEKKLEQGAPKLVSLAKPLTVELRKRSLDDVRARAALVLDISGSMSQRYANGTVQEIVNKTLPLAVQFDDDGELECWFYGTTCRRMPAVNMSNYERAVPEGWRKLMREIGGQTNAAKVMQEVMSEYSASKIPAYVLFITDGGFDSESKVKALVLESSSMPIFWQFVGIGGRLGGRGYGILEKLDSMKGRLIDNANFFVLDDFMAVSSSELYGRLLDEFPKWLIEARQKGLIA